MKDELARDLCSLRLQLELDSCQWVVGAQGGETFEVVEGEAPPQIAWRRLERASALAERVGGSSLSERERGALWGLILSWINR